ncbi:thiolase family protein [Rhizobium oryzihabitans]|jgi:acetyl-CoA acetyltransferase|uniref:thiolase family protein n=1 Tax=Rhizobium oryzihabitans TaxID=2267833 RepID=UPI004035CEB6
MFIIGRGETRGSGAEKRPSACEIAAFPVRGQTVLVSEDEHPRETTFEKLASLPTPLRSNGTVTAGNALGVNDGATAQVLTYLRAVKRHGLQPLAGVGPTAIVR